MVNAVGMAWYTRESYDRCLSIFDDAADYPGTFDEWLSNAQKTEKHFRKQGVRLIRAIWPVRKKLSHFLI